MNRIALEGLEMATSVPNLRISFGRAAGIVAAILVQAILILGVVAGSLGLGVETRSGVAPAPLLPPAVTVSR